MAKKKNKQNGKYQSNKNNLNSKNSAIKSDKVRDVDLELTNQLDITIDDERLLDTETLDTSFLEGKASKKVVQSICKECDDSLIEKKKNRFIVRVIIIIFLAILIGFASSLLFSKLILKPKVKTVVKTVTEKVTVIDDNYLFIGDSITEEYDLEKYYKKLPVVNSGVSGNTTEDILKDMEKRVYRYNPSKIFLLIGTNDFIADISSEETISNIKKIIDGIKENRPYSEIYLESIYPVNDSDLDKINHKMVDKRENEEIRKINEELKELAKVSKITYIDMYSLLEDEEENLKIEYTKDGLHMSDEGYEVITEELMKYIEK